MVCDISDWKYYHLLVYASIEGNIAYSDQHYQSHCIGFHGPVPCPPMSVELTLFDFVLLSLMKQMTCRTFSLTNKGIYFKHESTALD